MNAELKKQFQIVFNDKIKMNTCGRQECIKLIELLEKENSKITFGNKQNGFLNIENIKTFIKKNDL